jgi:hypothetical protein
MNKHATDVLSLVAGVVFVAIAGLWRVVRTVANGLSSFGGLVAGGLILAGVLGIAGTLRPGRTPQR